MQLADVHARLGNLEEAEHHMRRSIDILDAIAKSAGVKLKDHAITTPLLGLSNVVCMRARIHSSYLISCVTDTAARWEVPRVRRGR